MKEKITSLLNSCIEQATEDELQMIHQLLKGVQDKQKNRYDSYIGSIFQMDRDLNNQSCQITMPISKLTDNSLDIVHGGITATLLDSAMGTLANALLPDGYGAVTSNLSIYYIAPGIGETLKATANLIHQGSKTLILEGNVHRDDGKKIAHCTGTFFIIKK